jgi:hypothetical protein
LKFKGYHPTSPSNDATCRIRIWQDSLNLHYYDCECGERKPVSDLYKIKQHVKRHQVTEYKCTECPRIFKHHLQLNAHMKVHKTKG